MAAFDIEERYERRDALGGPFARSIGLHLLLVGSLALSVWLHARHPGNEWGRNLAAGSIQATLVSSAPSIPLPQVQKPTDNVLATETPSVAPAIEKQQTAPAPDLKAIPIPVKQQPAKQPPPKPAPPQQQQKHPQQQPPPKDRANFGEQQPSSLPRSMAQQQQGPPSPVAVAGGEGFHFGWYVDQITRKVRENWYIQEVDPSTPKGRDVVVTFTIARDGAPSNFQIARSSGSSTLDTSGIRAVQRVESFGPLPAGYNGSSLSVQYTFTYDQNGR